MNPLLSLLPGAAQASLILKTLGVTQNEEQALGSVLQSASNLPVVRSLPAELLPKGPREFIAWVAGLKSLGITPGVPAGVVRVLDNPVIRSAVAGEIERFITAHPQREEILSVLGKAISYLWPDTDIQSLATVTDVVDQVIFERLLNSPVPATVFACRSCGFTQVMDPAPYVTCRKCNFLQQVK